jgi:hypothetical protein
MEDLGLHESIEPSAWELTAKILQSPIAKSVSLVPILGHFLIYSDRITPFLENEKTLGRVLFYTPSEVIFSIYWGSVLIGFSLILHYMLCPFVVKNYRNVIEYIESAYKTCDTSLLTSAVLQPVEYLQEKNEYDQSPPPTGDPYDFLPPPKQIKDWKAETNAAIKEVIQVLSKGGIGEQTRGQIEQTLRAWQEEKSRSRLEELKRVLIALPDHLLAIPKHSMSPFFASLYRRKRAGRFPPTVLLIFLFLVPGIFMATTPAADTLIRSACVSLSALTEPCDQLKNWANSFDE